MHGGGNTSVKATVQDFFGRTLDVLYVKGSGWDLKTIEKPGFPAIRLEETCMLADLDTLSDMDMTSQLRALMLDPMAPTPSVEAILHAIIPDKFVDHTHTDAVVTLTNNPRGDAIMAELYPDCLILPYIMPGFVLSKQVKQAIDSTDLAAYKGIILAHHGVFTFSDDARTAYEDMIELVSRAEVYIEQNGAFQHGSAEEGAVQQNADLQGLARIRLAVSKQRGCAQLAILDSSPDAQFYACRGDVADIATRGPITPDHVIRTKRIPVIIEKEASGSVAEVADFAAAYREYFQNHNQSGLTILDTAPRAGVWKGQGCIAFGSSLKECGIISDIAQHTRWAVQTGETVGGWQALPEENIFELEYWSLEQAKLGKAGGNGKSHLGKIALVSGANGGIGKATCTALSRHGAVVVGLDINPDVVETLAGLGGKGIVCDLTNEMAVVAAVESVIESFGGLDILVCNAGMFKAGETIEVLSSEIWEQTMAVNLTATQRLLKAAIPFLKLGVEPTALLVGSRNYPAPGAGAAAYSVSKAGTTQLARVAALELAGDGVRVNVVHPDAVFDTGLWTEEALESSAQRYGLTVEEYKTKNMLGREITSADVGALLSVMASSVFGATTGAQVPVDGGSDRVI
jgi:rhamnose utilization protein RhaD (predicted bifunctional aldolase and dehydrogenase)/NAD(P)-dependent dehydrogenase (short-subunit alcohol dehydrogenase family)